MDRGQAPRNVGHDLRSILFDTQHIFFAENWLFCVILLELCGYINFVNFTNCPRTFGRHCIYTYIIMKMCIPESTPSRRNLRTSSRPTVVDYYDGRGSKHAYPSGRRQSHGGVELMMECVDDDLSPAQLAAIKRAKEEHEKVTRAPD